MHYPENSLSKPTATETATATSIPTSQATETATPTPTPTATPDPSNKVTYTYDGDGKLVMSQVGSTVTFLLADHLGSTSVTTDSSGVLVSSMLYTAFGETRTSTGSPASDYRYTGQREESEIGLYFYNARFYDAYLNRTR